MALSDTSVPLLLLLNNRIEYGLVKLDRETALICSRVMFSSKATDFRIAVGIEWDDVKRGKHDGSVVDSQVPADSNNEINCSPCACQSWICINICA